MLKTSWMKYLSWYLVVAMFVIGITPRAFAEFSPSEVIGLPGIDRTSDLQKIRKVLEMKMVSERLKEFGLTPDEIQMRLNHLSDLQIHQIAVQLDELTIGGDGVVAAVIIILLMAILAGVILYLTGHRIKITK